MNEEMKQQPQPQQAQQQPQQSGNGIEQIVAELKKKGLEVEQIVEELKKLLDAGQITEEDFAQATQLLEEDEKAEASKMFGMNLL